MCVCVCVCVLGAWMGPGYTCAWRPRVAPLLTLAGGGHESADGGGLTEAVWRATGSFGGRRPSFPNFQSRHK